jgi:hypothetical protein
MVRDRAQNGGDMATDLPDHCWHDTGTVAESYPELYEQRCCLCGETRWIHRRAVLPGGRVVDLPWVEDNPPHEAGAGRAACSSKAEGTR